MRPSRSLCAGFALLLSLVPASSSVAQLLVNEAAGLLRMDVMARIAQADGQKQVVPVDDDSVLRTGDGVQVRLHVAQDAYVYVIVYGSSESAVVLHPFTGRREESFMRAGEERVIPGPDRFLPLDRRAGVESIYAFASPAPVRLMSSLLVRMEAGGGDRAAVIEALRASHPGALALSFRHTEASVAGGGAGGAGTAESWVTAAAPAPRLPALQGTEEQGVLSAEGSRIEAFISGRPVPEQPLAIPPAATGQETPEARPPSGGASASKPAPGAKSGGWFGRLFRFGSGESPSPAAGAAPAEKAVPATTYALPASTDGEPGSETVTVDAGDVTAAPDVAEQQAKTAAVESAQSSTEPPLAGSGGVDPQLNISVLDDVVAMLGESPERDTGSGESAGEAATAAPEPEAPAPAAVESSEAPTALPLPPPEPEPTQGGSGGSLFGALGTLFAGDRTTGPQADAGDAAGAPKIPPAIESSTGTTLPSAPAEAETSPDPVAGDESPAAVETPTGESVSSGGSLLTRLFGAPQASNTAAPFAGVEPEPVAESAPEAPALDQTTDMKPPDAAPAGKVAIGPAGSTEPEPASKALTIGPAETPAPDLVPSSQKGGAAASADASTAVAPESGGFLSGLTSLFGGGPAKAPAQEETEKAAGAAEPSVQETAAAPATADASSGTQADGAPRVGDDAAAEAVPSARKSGVAAADAPASKTVAIGPAETSSPEPAQDAALTTIAEPEPPARETVAARAVAEASSATRADDESAEPVPSSQKGGAAAASADASTAAAPESGGFLSGLTSLFGGTPAKPPPQKETAEASGEPAPASPVVVARPPPAEEPAAAATPEETGGGGFLGGLSRLFGGDAGRPSKPGDQASRRAVSAQTETTPEPAEPAFKTVTRADGKQVVIVQGPPGRPDAPPASSDVLAGEGNKIRALLEPAETVVPEDDGVLQERRQAAAPAQPATEQTTIAQKPDEPALTASAATAGPSPDVSVSPPSATADAAAVAPDEVQAALEAGAPTVRPPAETLAALTAPAPAAEISVAPVQEIDVTAADNVSSSIVLVVTPTGTGSGVLLDDTGHVLANWHVVSGYSTVSVSFKSPNLDMPSMERTFSARVVRLNKTADLALLRVDSPPEDVFPVRFADAAGIKTGDVLHAIGHPASGAWTHTLGKIDDVKPESSWYAGRNLLHRGTVIQAKVLDDPGSAGAPLFNNRLELVGISAVARSKKGVLTGVSVETIRRFLEAPPAGG